MSTFDDILSERYEDGRSSITVEPVGDDAERAFLVVSGEHQQVIVDYGWDDTGTMFITVQTFVDGEPRAAQIFDAGETVMIAAG